MNCPQGSEVGIAQLDTYAGLLYGTHPNIVMHVYPSDSLMLADLQAHHIAAGTGLAAVDRVLRHRAPAQPSLQVRLAVRQAHALEPRCALRLAIQERGQCV